MNQTFTDVHGDDELIERIRDCWASLYGERVMAYRVGQGEAGPESGSAEPALAVVVLARLAARLEQRYGAPQDIEWAVEAGQTYLVQSRPIIAMGGRHATEATASAKPDGADPPLLTGLAGSPGRASG